MVLDACIQRFEYTCELSVKYMRRQLKALVDPLPALQMYLIRDDQSQSQGPFRVDICYWPDLPDCEKSQLVTEALQSNRI